jgi:O-antigen ligase
VEFIKNIKSINSEKLGYFFAIGILVSLPLLQVINSLFILAFFLNWLFFVKKTQIKSLLFNCFIFFFLFHILALINSPNIDSGLFEIEKKLSFLVIPIAFSGITFSVKQRNFLLITFVLACLTGSLLCLIQGFYIYLDTNDLSWFYNQKLSGLISMHPVYFSMYLSLAIFIIIDSIMRKNQTIFFPPKIAFSVIVFFLIFIALLSARMQIITLAIIVLSFSLFYLIFIKFSKRNFFLFVLFFIALFASIVFIPINRERFKEAINYNSEYSIDKQWGGRALRELKWNCSMNVISNNFLFGVGTGGAQNALEECYNTKGYGQLLFYDKVSYNSHNQYFETFITLGIIGLVLFLGIFFFGFLYAIKNNDFLFLSFLILFFFSCLTESMLERQNGIVFFTFFACLFYKTPSTKEIDTL